MFENSNNEKNSSQKMLSSFNSNSNISTPNDEQKMDFKDLSDIYNNISNNEKTKINENDDNIEINNNKKENDELINIKEESKKTCNDTKLMYNPKDPLTDINTFKINQKLEGFDNIGNTCYMNSFLQILLHIPGFYLKLKEVKDEKKLNNKLINNIISLYEEQEKRLYLQNIKKYMGKINQSYAEYSQNDSQEFGIDLINELISLIKNDQNISDDDCFDETNNDILANKLKMKKELFNEYINKYHNKNNEIFLEKMFQFHESKLKIEEKENKIIEISNIYYETFLHIELVFPKNKNKKNYDLLDLFNYKYKFYDFNSENLNQIEKKIEIKSQILEEHNKLKEPKKLENNDTSTTINDENWFDTIKGYCKSIFSAIFSSCLKNKKPTDIEEKTNDLNYIYINKLASLPKVLIISIDRSILGQSLIDYKLNFKESLEISQFVDKDILDVNYVNYNLYAINECYGHTKESGHYYSYIKIAKNWHKFNDRSVTNESPSLSSKYVVGLYYIKEEGLND